MNRVIVICGPTAVGKTKYSIEIAKRYNGEIVSCDSMQLYKYMTIGSAKPTIDELNEVKHHLVDFMDPRDEFSVSIYSNLARKVIDDILGRGKTPVVSGGTGLYLNSILYEMDFSKKNKNDELRKNLEEKDNIVLYEMLKKIDMDSANRIHPNNKKKIIRAIECSGLKDFKSLNTVNPNINPILVCLTRNRDELYERIDQRVNDMIIHGLFNEVKYLLDLGLKFEDISMKGIGYKEIIEHFNGKYSKEEAIDLIKKNTRHYAKRQITWFKRYNEMNWINISDFKTENDVLSAICEIIDK